MTFTHIGIYTQAKNRYPKYQVMITINNQPMLVYNNFLLNDVVQLINSYNENLIITLSDEILKKKITRNNVVFC